MVLISDINEKVESEAFENGLQLAIVTDGDTLTVVKNAYAIPLGVPQPLSLLGKIIMNFGHHLREKHLPIASLGEGFPPGTEVCEYCGGYWKSNVTNWPNCQDCIEGVVYG